MINDLYSGENKQNKKSVEWEQNHLVFMASSDAISHNAPHAQWAIMYSNSTPSHFHPHLGYLNYSISHYISVKFMYQLLAEILLYIVQPNKIGILFMHSYREWSNSMFLFSPLPLPSPSICWSNKLQLSLWNLWLMFNSYGIIQTHLQTNKNQAGLIVVGI